MEFIWTSHAKYKMQFYRLSESRVKRVISRPERIEEGIAEDTVAMMQPAGTKNNPYEIWVMVTRSKNKELGIVNNKKGMNIKVISAWRYPGRTKPGEALPEDILRELREAAR